jgi:hypothetical protein
VALIGEGKAIAPLPFATNELNALHFANVKIPDAGRYIVRMNCLRYDFVASRTWKSLHHIYVYFAPLSVVD